jgi:hypothetical protein
MFLYVVAPSMNTNTDTLMGAALFGHYVFQSLDCARFVLVTEAVTVAERGTM